MCIKSEVEEIFFNLQQMTKVMRPFWYKNAARTCTKWLYAHALGLFFFFSNNDPGLILTIFMTGSNLFPDASVWVTA